MSYGEIVESASSRMEQLLRCIVCERVLGQYVMREPRQLIIKCPRCGALQARDLQMTVAARATTA
jgi:phage FluMu protein Com